MSTQVTCDKCEKVIENNEEKNVYLEWKTDEGHNFVHSVDLCKSCFEKMLEVIGFNNEKV